MCVTGVFCLWWGWYGFNPGSTLAVSGLRHLLAAKVAVTTTMAAASSGLAAIGLSYLRFGYYDPYRIVNGLLGGLVAITGCCAYVEPWEAIVIGIITAPIVDMGSDLVVRLGVDDVVTAVGVHVVAAVWGQIATGLFSRPPVYFEDPSILPGLFHGGGPWLLCVQVIGIVCIAAWSALLTFLCMGVFKYFGALTVSEKDQHIGLDFSEHGAGNLQVTPSGYLMQIPNPDEPLPITRLKCWARSPYRRPSSVRRPSMAGESVRTSPVDPCACPHTCSRTRFRLRIAPAHIDSDRGHGCRREQHGRKQDDVRVGDVFQYTHRSGVPYQY
jgi:hypothetical protein